jgi:hypothetical protein
VLVARFPEILGKRLANAQDQILLITEQPDKIAVS